MHINECRCVRVHSFMEVFLFLFFVFLSSSNVLIIKQTSSVIYFLSLRALFVCLSVCQSLSLSLSLSPARLPPLSLSLSVSRSFSLFYWVVWIWEIQEIDLISNKGMHCNCFVFFSFILSPIFHLSAMSLLYLLTLLCKKKKKKKKKIGNLPCCRLLWWVPRQHPEN